MEEESVILESVTLDVSDFVLQVSLRGDSSVIQWI